MEPFSDLNKQILRRRERIQAVSAALLNFATPDEKGTFRLDDIYSEYTQHFLKEIAGLRNANVQLEAAMEHAHGIYASLDHSALTLSARTDDPIEVIESRIHSLRYESEQKKLQLQKLTVIDPETLGPVVPPKDQEQAESLRHDIRKIPELLHVLESALAQAQQPFAKLERPPCYDRLTNLPDHRAALVALS